MNKTKDVLEKGKGCMYLYQIWNGYSNRYFGVCGLKL